MTSGTLLAPRASLDARPRADGKFVHAGAEKLYLRGVTYGDFREAADGWHFPAPAIVEADFAGMAANGINLVRTYTVPPPWLLDLAASFGLWVMVGIPWEQHVAFLGRPSRRVAIERRVREGVKACAGHPAVLCYAVGNEIPSSIVRWHGRRRIERFIERLYTVAKEEDPDRLVTYINYPSTEYLRLPFLDLVCFNVFLEDEERLEAYLARLQTLAGDRPLVVAELGLDSGRNGEEAQSVSLDWQIRTAFRGGCAGAIVFSWTDEWHVGGEDVEDWHFGLTDVARRPRPALDAVREAFTEVPFPNGLSWPPVSVVVCTYNGASTLGDCLDGVSSLDYPDYEIIVVDDGSTDSTADIAGRYDVRLIRTENNGLSGARNHGLAAATGEIVAYIDDDARPDPHWLRYLAAAFMATPHAGVGGPNIPPANGHLLLECVAAAPGGPIHVLLSDREAEHIPGCNMAFRRSRLEQIGGFDPQFRVAGDDVDVCWRLRDAGWTLGFSPGAMVWHRPRGSIRRFLGQQFEYGKAEALLERRWPERYNRMGHLAWAGHVYGGAMGTIARRWKVYYGTWGTGLFQSASQPRPGLVATLPLMPEWYLVTLALALCSALGAFWPPLLLAIPLLILSIGGPIAQAVLGGARASFRSAPGSRMRRLGRRAIVDFLYLAQPIARLCGRLRHGLTPWRRRSGIGKMTIPWRRTRVVWTERWHMPADRLRALESWLQDGFHNVRRGSPYDRWDLQVRGGPLGAARLRVGVEEHGGGCQLARYSIWPRPSRGGLALATLLAALGVLSALDGPVGVAVVFAALALALAARMVREFAAGMRICLTAIEALASEPDTWLLGSGEPAPAEEEPDDLGAALRQRIRKTKAAVAYAAPDGEQGEP